MLDRLFRLYREDLVGPLREELQDELKHPPAQFTKLYSNPRLVGVQFKPVPHFVLRVPIPPRILQVGGPPCVPSKAITQLRLFLVNDASLLTLTLTLTRSSLSAHHL